MKTVLITGANKSIGFETAKQLLDLGYYVYLGSRDLEKGAEAIAQLNSKNVEAIKIDVSNAQSVTEARKIIGGKTDSLDVLINNAGISGGFPQSSSTTSIETIREVFDTNFFGAIQVTNAFMDLLKKSEAPRIVNVTSGLGSLALHNDPSWKFYNYKSAAYGPSKTALNAYTITLAFELKDTVFKVNVVDPGYTATDFNRHSGPRNVSDAAKDIVKFAILDENGPTGKFFSIDNNPETGDSPW
ncbi:SDR family NAD(P)-dependent oxidoreductase [Mucilaginibacter sp. OK098]|uniref:SDR family NAD(P)-dependent oxidoreductase n=1 Tax=Mucilaginibacter sp. OK098 TaxID=1855297 RepID=UPI00091C4D32|nr:SDR family NAD(P)-dependent oxidoreductase [Mucilaginibacter sp. OK098]SHM25516.1 NAD(P)-dependent dehydrogenase, short-chain alcohol dehydrogenase family [Mucilaginibacter sp. OK098]